MVEGAAKTAVDLRALAQSLEPQLLDAVHWFLSATLDTARQLVRVETGLSRDSILAVVDRGPMPRGRVYVDPGRRDRRNRVRADEHVLWLEFGTSRVTAQPFLAPAAEQHVPEYRRRVRALMEAAVQRHGG